MAGDVAQVRALYEQARAMNPDLREDLRGELERLAGDGAQRLDHRVRAVLLASVLGVARGEDPAAALATAEQLLGMGRQLAELRMLPTVKGGGTDEYP